MAKRKTTPKAKSNATPLDRLTTYLDALPHWYWDHPTGRLWRLDDCPDCHTAYCRRVMLRHDGPVTYWQTCKRLEKTVANWQEKLEKTDNPNLIEVIIDVG